MTQSQASALVSKAAVSIYEEYTAVGIDFDMDVNRSVAYIGFHLARQYFHAVESLNGQDLIISASGIVRSGLENASDLFYIFSKLNKDYGRSYVGSMQAFHDAMKKAAAAGQEQVALNRMMKQVNPWTNASIEDRLKFLGEDLLFTYDMLSYFSHPNPAAVQFLVRPEMNNAVGEMASAANNITMLHVMAFSVLFGEIKSVKEAQLEVIANQLGFKLFKKP
jgi:hypothetical protein